MSKDKPNQIISYAPKELAEALVKNQGIHKGFWGLYVEFKLIGANTGPKPDEIYPTAMIPITKIGIKQTEIETPLSVDAAKVNPRPKTSTRTGTRGHRR